MIELCFSYFCNELIYFFYGAVTFFLFIRQIHIVEHFLQKINEHQSLIRKVTFMYARNESEADDIFQEICIQLWHSFPHFQGKAKFSTWLYRIAINTCVSWIRKESRYKKADEVQDFLQLGIDDETFYEKEEKKEQLNAMYKAIKRLNEVDRTLIMLYLDEVAYPEIADIMGLSINNIKVKMYRIKKRLRKLMEEL